MASAQDGRVRLIEDAAYLMAAWYCGRTKVCETCPAASECLDPDNTVKPAALLCQHFLAQAESKQEGDVPSWA